MMLGFLALQACTEQNFTAVELDAIALVNGDFDDIGESLLRNEIGNVAFNGYIAQSTTWVGDEPPSREDPGRTVEQLLTEPVPDKAQFEIQQYNAVFFNSGTRGLNAFRYNYNLDPDDSLLLDEKAMTNACDYIEANGSVFVTDWAYDLVEHCLPDAIEFLGDDSVVDAAQAGVAGTVLADVPDEELAATLETSVVNVEFNYSAFAVIEKVGSDVEVLLRGDVSYEAEEGGIKVMTGAPLAVRIPVGKSGQVYYSSFHLSPQTPALADALLFRGMVGLEPGAGDKSEEAAGE